ncbi:DUF6632 domain-containing protein [Nocardia rhizosphaerihabitans]|uniref:DUF6632 domain-containing protein n=1 Tax=Nocardia rhizosphaerihabitans TaxID=1691570 RepID=UPI0036703CB2
MSTTSQDVRIVRLQWGLRIGGAAMILFFVIAAIGVLTNYHAMINENGGLLGELTAWSDHDGHEYALMIAVIYIVWGAFVWRAARDPLRHRLMVEFTIVGNFAHLGVMGLMAIFDSTHTAHLLGDVPLGLLLPIILTILWLPVRQLAT